MRCWKKDENARLDTAAISNRYNPLNMRIDKNSEQVYAFLGEYGPDGLLESRVLFECEFRVSKFFA